MARRPSTSTLGFLAVVALAALGGWILVTRTVLPALDTMRFGFPVYYTSSRLVVDGVYAGSTRRVDDDACVLAQPPVALTERVASREMATGPIRRWRRMVRCRRVRRVENGPAVDGADSP